MRFVDPGSLHLLLSTSPGGVDDPAVEAFLKFCSDVGSYSPLDDKDGEGDEFKGFVKDLTTMIEAWGSSQGEAEVRCEGKLRHGGRGACVPSAIAKS